MADSSTPQPQLSTFEAMARKARNQSTATVSILYSKKRNGRKAPMKYFVGSGFIIKLEGGGCKVLTCEHVIHDFRNSTKWDIWVRMFQADADVKATIQYRGSKRDLAILNVDTLPAMASPPTTLKFSAEKGIGTKVVMLGYFNPPVLESFFDESSVIAKKPSPIPGEIVGPRRNLLNVKWNWDLIHSCNGIGGCSGSPLISWTTGKALGVFDSTDPHQMHSAIATHTVKAQLRCWFKHKRALQDRLSLRAMIKTL